MSSAPVLLIDDDRNVRDTVRDMLDLEGIPARGVEPDVDLEAALRDEGVRVIVTDLNMPQRDGIQILQEVRRLSQELGIRVSVFVATGAGGEGRLLEAEAEGAVGCFQKPFDLDAFVGRIRDELAGHAA